MATADQVKTRFLRPLHIAVLVKQIPSGEMMRLGKDGCLVREGIELEMNAFCRRAVAKGVEWARQSGGTCTAFSLGPSSAEDVLREAIAWGVDAGVHLCDPAFAGSDTLATARALVAAMVCEKAFDLILAGRTSLDGETGQVGPQIAQLIGMPFAEGVRQMSLVGEELALTLQHDDGVEEVGMSLPAVLSVAERLCDPCKVPPELRAEVARTRISVKRASDLGAGPFGRAGSTTRVGRTRLMIQNRVSRVLSGTIVSQIAQATSHLVACGALPRDASRSFKGTAPLETEERERKELSSDLVGVLIEPGRYKVSMELLGAASRLAIGSGITVQALSFDSMDPAMLGAAGADAVTTFEGIPTPDDVAYALLEWEAGNRLRALIGPSTAFGREVLGRLAAALGAGLIGDAIGLDIVGGQIVAAKTAFSGALVADITCISEVTLVSVRPGWLPLPTLRRYDPQKSSWLMHPRSRVRRHSLQRDDDIEVLARAEVVIGVGAGVSQQEYGELSELTVLLHAEQAATRKVADRGWIPRSRQIGVTGRSIAPSLYIAIGISGGFNHMAGVRGAGTIVAINNDPDAAVFSQCDVGIVGDWREVVPLFAEALRSELEP